MHHMAAGIMEFLILIIFVLPLLVSLFVTFVFGRKESGKSKVGIFVTTFIFTAFILCAYFFE